MQYFKDLRNKLLAKLSPRVVLDLVILCCLGFTKFLLAIAKLGFNIFKLCLGFKLPPDEMFDKDNPRWNLFYSISAFVASIIASIFILRIANRFLTASFNHFVSFIAKLTTNAKANQDKLAIPTSQQTGTTTVTPPSSRTYLNLCVATGSTNPTNLVTPSSSSENNGVTKHIGAKKI